jgi:hypothetical protein
MKFGFNPPKQQFKIMLMSKGTKIVLFVIAILLIFNGLINVVDNGSILAYDIASVLSGFGFIIVVLAKKA